MGLRFSVDLAGWRAAPDHYTAAYIKPFLEAMCAANMLYIKTHPGTPSILDPIAGVRYQREKGSEIWKDIPSILRDRFADCEDLACARVAELRCGGFPARPILLVGARRSGPGRLFHVIVGFGNRREDPSKLLGMTGEA